MNTVIVQCDSCGAKNRIPEVKQHLRPHCGKCGGTLDMRRFAVPVQLGDRDLQDFLNSSRLPVMVDFFSPGCGPCRALAPLIDTLARRFVGEFVIAKLDTSQHARSASLYGIRAVPTLMFFRGGKMVDQIVGAPSEAQLVSKIRGLADKIQG